MQTRVTQEQTYNYMKSLPKTVTQEQYQKFQSYSLYIHMSARGIRIQFQADREAYTYKIDKLKLSHLYRGVNSDNRHVRVPLQVGSLMLWDNINGYITQKQHDNQKEGLTIELSDLRYLGTVDESVNDGSIQSNQVLPYRLTHSLLTPDNKDVLYIQDIDTHTNKQTNFIYYQEETYQLNYLESDKLNRLVNWGQTIESELSKKLKEERDIYKELYESEEQGFDLSDYEVIDWEE